MLAEFTAATLTAEMAEAYRQSIKVRNKCRRCVHLLTDTDYCNEQTQAGHETPDGYWCITHCTGFEPIEVDDEQKTTTKGRSR